jgi:hypothetical protein
VNEGKISSQQREKRRRNVHQNIFESTMSSIRCLLNMTSHHGMHMATYIPHCRRHSPALVLSSTSVSLAAQQMVCDKSWCWHCGRYGDSDAFTLKKRLEVASNIPVLMADANLFELSEPSLQQYRDAIFDFDEWQAWKGDGTGWDSSLPPQIMELIDNEYSSIDHNKLKQLLLNISPSHQQQHEHHSNNVTASSSSVLMVSPTTSTILLEPLCDIIISYLDPPNMYPLTYMIYRLWNNSVIQRIWKYRTLFWHLDCTHYFLNRVHLIGSSLPRPVDGFSGPPTLSSSIVPPSSSLSTTPISFEISETDQLFARARTSGIVVTEIEIPRRRHDDVNPNTTNTVDPSHAVLTFPSLEGQLSSSSLSSCASPSPPGSWPHRLRLYDIGGQRGERKKWIHAFDDVDGWYVTAITVGIFLSFSSFFY